MRVTWSVRMTVKSEQLVQDSGHVNVSTMIEECGVMQFLWAEDMAAKDIHKEMLPIYGEHCLSRHAVHN